MEKHMVDNTDRGSSNNTLYFIVGGLVVLAGVFAFLYANDYVGGGGSDVNVSVEQPAAPAAPEAPAPATGGTTATQ
jgi:hypothetical protein